MKFGSILDFAMTEVNTEETSVRIVNVLTETRNDHQSN